MDRRPSPACGTHHLDPRRACRRLEDDQAPHPTQLQDHLRPVRLDQGQLVVVERCFLRPGRPGPAHPGQVRYDRISENGDESEVTVSLARFEADACRDM
ncbi:hypothetical protein ABK046_36435 [Streptomyces caeruleatus]